MKRHIIVAILSVLCALANAQALLSPNAKTSLLTCSPGEQIYLKFGHTALRICDPEQGIDLVFNYGVFSFNEDYFIPHFVAGETDYHLAVQSYARFINSYDAEGRQVFEQILRLDSAQRQDLFERLTVNALPENKVYRYNFIFDNCATRPYVMLDSVLGGKLSAWPPKEDTGTTFRQAIRHYTHTNSWGQLGIDLCFGTDADRPMRNDEPLFLPERLMDYVAEVEVDGKKLADNSVVMQFDIADTDFITSPGMVMVALLLLTVVFCFVSIRRTGRVPYLIDITVYLVSAIIGTLLIYLWFFSVHAFVQNNWNVVILNPLMLVMFTIALTARGRRWLSGKQHALLAYDLAAIAAYLLSPQDNMLVLTLLMTLITLHVARLMATKGVVQKNHGK